jgi:hypothetical protein
MADGDGTVNLRSLERPLREWTPVEGGPKLEVHAFQGSNHFTIFTDPRVSRLVSRGA